MAKCVVDIESSLWIWIFGTLKTRLNERNASVSEDIPHGKLKLSDQFKVKINKYTSSASASSLLKFQILT